MDALHCNIHGKEIKFPFIKILSQEESDFLRKYTVFRLNLISSQINFLTQDVKLKRIEQTLKTAGMVSKIANLEELFKTEVCSDLLNVFWERKIKMHSVDLPYVDGFNERVITTKARPIQMNHELMGVCKTKINNLLNNKIIRPFKSPWSYSVFYVNNNAEKERGAPRLVINYKPLNSVLKWIRYAISNKKYLLK